jgi:hypothetical protein
VPRAAGSSSRPSRHRIAVATAAKLGAQYNSLEARVPGAHARRKESACGIPPDPHRRNAAEWIGRLKLTERLLSTFTPSKPPFRFRPNSDVGEQRSALQRVGGRRYSPGLRGSSQRSLCSIGQATMQSSRSLSRGSPIAAALTANPEKDIQPTLLWTSLRRRACTVRADGQTPPVAFTRPRVRTPGLRW